MSDLSLLTGVYADVEAYGVLIDRVIERLRRYGSDPTDPDQKKLAQLFIDANDQGLRVSVPRSIDARQSTQDDTGEPLANLKQLGERLQDGNVDQAYLRQLEKLAQGLEQERADIARRLRGG